MRQNRGHRSFAETAELMSVPFDVRADAGDLIDRGDLAVGEVGDLSVELESFVAR